MTLSRRSFMGMQLIVSDVVPKGEMYIVDLSEPKEPPLNMYEFWLNRKPVRVTGLETKP